MIDVAMTIVAAIVGVGTGVLWFYNHKTNRKVRLANIYPEDVHYALADSFVSFAMALTSTFLIGASVYQTFIR